MKSIVNYYFHFILIIFSFSTLKADEGMWLPVLLDQLNITTMQANGFKLSAEDIYSLNKSSMKDAVVQFGTGCTAELISGKGLLLTNHHCGYGSIQSHSSVERNYLDDGFWAMNQSQELVCPGLSVTFIVSMEDVTAIVLDGITDTTSEYARKKKIDTNVRALEKANSLNGIDAMVRAFYYGNVYYMFFTQTFKDVRLVGAPPQTIGNFGGDSDNWVWPRQTGDFSLFRIYADKNNNPAIYAVDNIPYTPKHFFKINANGIGENDFTMVYGFPGRTNEYLSSFGVELIQNVSNPIKISLRDTRIKIMEQEMYKNPVVKIQYASKRNGAANAWKKWQGEQYGLIENKVIDKKQSYEGDFSTLILADQFQGAKYQTLLMDLQSAYNSIRPYQIALDYSSEGSFSIESVRFAWSFNNLIQLEQTLNPDAKERQKQLDLLRAAAENYFKDFDLVLEKKLAVAIFKQMKNGMPQNFLPPVFELIEKKYDGNIQEYIDEVYAKSLFVSKKKVMNLLNNYKPSDWKKIMKDKSFAFSSSLYVHYNLYILPKWMTLNSEINRLNRIYMAAQMQVFPSRKFYPDANFTLRVAFGKVAGYNPRNAVHYNWFTTLDGVMEKADSTTLDYKVPQRLKQLWSNRDFGNYADRKDGKLHTAFIATNHTTGGNSGSPVIDAYGNLIGTNFDRTWEGTISDLDYEIAVCRNISLDVRYTLFIIDKYAGAGYLLKEMEFVPAGSY